MAGQSADGSACEASGEALPGKASADSSSCEAMASGLINGEAIVDALTRTTSVDASLAEASVESTRSAVATSAPGERIDIAPEPDADAAAELRLEPGARVGRYVILDEIGEGGMSIVYVARDPQLDRKVAIKVMRRLAPAGSAVSQRLVREAHALARVIHPNVIPVYDVGTVRGQLFLVEEYVEGGTLAQWVEREPRAWRDILRAFMAAGRGLHAAHEAGLVHRDFKPGNVLIGRDGRVRVIDFGLSCGTGSIAAGSGGDEPSPLDRGLTRTGSVMGTLAYMAPEQQASMPVDARSDLFGFCVALWEALYGERPFDGKTPADRAAAVVRGVIRAPGSTRVPPGVRRALLHGLRVSPADRPPSMAALLDEIDRGARRIPRRALAVIAAVGLAAVAAMAVLAGARLVSVHEAAPAPSCLPLPAGATDVYVDPAAAAAGTGAPGCPLRTLTAALGLPRGAAHRTIHLAAGTYDHASGERFPLVVRGDVTIAGTGEDATRIVGAGKIDHRAAGGVLDVAFAAAMVVGDTSSRVAVADLSLASETAAPEMSVFGVVCDRGTMSAFDGPLPAANTRLSHVTLGPGFEAALVVGTSSHPAPTGCNLELVGSTLRGSYVGGWLLGCGIGDVRIPVRAAIGDGSESGRNVFHGLHQPGHAGAGLKVWDCVRSLAIRRNTFEDSDGGIAVVRHIDEHAASELLIEHNNLHALDRFGAVFRRAAIVDRFDDNDLYDITAHPDSAAERASAVLLDGEGEHAPGFPQIRHARGNVIDTSDVGIELRGSLQMIGRPVIDFGRPDDPGHNRLLCNGTERGSRVPGYDVLLTLPSDGAAEILLAGNTWDHAIPRIARAGAPNGTEIILPPGAVPRIDVTGAVRSPDACGFNARPP